ncbi:hypothetical protein PUR49_11150 [Streptomyces sp. BE147]|uniref:hypothetical protein n=1 Tax=Streptomyces sp. BE147 TaxID=3002524 RepID=UPI002E76D5CA|nr:hypothetical protein [Streptomyces sp. BE147]MEE1737052.1 hypothetical protein [Streptomyces sp. BE147]
MIRDIEAAARDADIALAALDQTGIPFQVGGDLALAQHQVLRRGATEISLTTPVTHSTDRSRDVVQGALEHLGFRVLVEQGAGRQQGLLRAMNYLPPSTPDAPDFLSVRMTITVKPQYNAPVDRAGLRVSSMTTLSVQTLQAVQSRLDPRDFIDLAAHEEHWGQQTFASLTDQVVLRAVRDQSPRLDPVEPYLRLHKSLKFVQHIPNHQFTALGVREGQIERIRTTIAAMAERVFSTRPRPRPGTSAADAALEHLRTLTPGQRGALPARLAMPAARAAVVDRHPSSVPPKPLFPPAIARPAADSQYQHQQGGPQQQGRPIR